MLGQRSLLRTKVNEEYGAHDLHRFWAQAKCLLLDLFMQSLYEELQVLFITRSWLPWHFLLIIMFYHRWVHRNFTKRSAFPTCRFESGHFADRNKNIWQVEYCIHFSLETVKTYVHATRRKTTLATFRCAKDIIPSSAKIDSCFQTFISSLNIFKNAPIPQASTTCSNFWISCCDHTSLWMQCFRKELMRLDIYST